MSMEAVVLGLGTVVVCWLFAKIYEAVRGHELEDEEGSKQRPSEPFQP